MRQKLNGGLVRLREVLERLSPSERKAAEYILAYPDEVVSYSVAQLAEASGSSQAAIVRLCKSMGLKGYPDLKLKIAGDLQDTGPNHGYQEIRPQDSIASLIRNVSANNVQSIHDTAKILDPDLVEQAVNALDKAKRIYFFGVGASGLIAQDAQHKFLRIGKTCFSFADPHIQLTSAVALTPDDAAVAISYSGETREIVAALRTSAERGAKTISITKYGQTSLHGYSQIPLCIASTETEIRSGAMASRITQLNVIDILYLGVASRHYDRAVHYLDQSRAVIRELES